MRANAIYATDEREAAIRMGHLQEAMASCYVLEAYINQIAEDGPKRPCDAGKDYADQRPCVTPGQLAELCNRCASVERLVKAVIKSDRARWRRPRTRRRPSRMSL